MPDAGLRHGGSMSSHRILAFAVLALPLAAAGCRKSDITDGRYQGMIELEQTDLGFELGGKLAALDVHAGMDIAAGDPIAHQDDELDREEREIRARELDVAKSELALIQAGSRAEDVRAARAQVTAAKANEAALIKDVEREKALVSRGAVPGAHLDDLEAQLASASGNRTALEQKLRALSAGARDEEVAR